MRALFAGTARIALTALTGLATLVACNDKPDDTLFGSFAMTTSAPTTTFTTVDGWNVVVTKLLVHVTAVTVAGGDLVVAATTGPQIFDQAAPGAKPLLSAGVRTARAWEDVSLEIGPAAAGDIALIEPVNEADRDQLQRDGLSLYLEATISRAGAQKLLKLGFKTDTLDHDCAGELNGTLVHGLVIPPDGIDIADIAMAPSVLFADDLTAPAPVLRGSPFSTADANADGTITTDELAAQPLVDVRTATTGTYAVGDKTDIADLGAFVSALSRKMVSSFRAKGSCLADPQPAP